KKTTLINDTLLKKEKIYLFPNPTQSKNINVKFKEKIGKCVILLESIDGKLISTKKTIVANNDQVENLNFQTKLPTGNYNVIIKFEDGTKAILPLIIL
ncbi:MAG: T9SS type A sorting domain-containing protein, partial [Ferruginibacter sp.]